jgi:iron complex outermembrane receptor protein
MSKQSSFAVRSLIALAVASAFRCIRPWPQKAAVAAAAEAQDTPAAAEPAANKDQLETVIVTAQRRAENIKDVPMSIATIKGDKLDALTSGAGDIRVLSGRSPSLNIESDYGRASRVSTSAAWATPTST